MQESQPTEIIQKVTRFYEELPFNYDRTGREALLRIKKNPLRSYPALADILDRGRISSAIEFGCGTGWFCASLARHWRTKVVGLDATARAVHRARQIVAALGLEDKVDLRIGNIFEYDTSTSTFDLVVSLGVLHHTSDCKQAFSHIARAVSKGGYLFVGLYHRYGRQVMLQYFHDLVAANGEAAALEQYRLMHPELEDSVLEESWFKDQILHPHETTHTLDEVWRWLDEAGLTMVATSINNDERIEERARLIEQEKDYARVSYVRNVLQKRFFPGFFTVLARRDSR